MRQAQRVTVTHAVECRPMLLAIAAKATVLMTVFMHRGKLIQALSIAVSALPGHPVGADALRAKLVGTFSPGRLTAVRM